MFVIIDVEIVFIANVHALSSSSSSSFSHPVDQYTVNVGCHKNVLHLGCLK